MARHSLLAIAFASLLAGTFTAAASAQEAKPEDPWPSLASDIFHDRTMMPDARIIQLSAPARAEDAALVPMTVHLGADSSAAGSRITKVTLVIDQNPAPVAAVFELGPKSRVSMIETRVRVDQYTNVHAVAETADGHLYVATAFVKAAGGCSAPAAKDAEEAKAHIGEMRFKLLPNPQAAPAKEREALLMIRHPNNSGMQMDQITHYYIPALYVTKVKIMQGADLVLAVDGGISISQDPNFRFAYLSNGGASMHVDATDSSGRRFSKDWPISQAM